MGLDGPEEAPGGRNAPLHRGLWRHWGSPAAIYGTIVYASVVAAASGQDDDQASAVRLLVFSVVSIVVFWLAHVYSTALGFQGETTGGTRVRDSVRHALRESGGMLEAAVVPSIPLVLAALGVLPPDFGVALALWLAVLMLALLGYSVFAVRGRPVPICLLGAVVTGAFGVVVILLKSALQH
ncbi:hypothetical protein [Leifsonia sp. fls2-241-R2A-40a]|uniref:hypothetical protein n=1 Tax=Leifsonia sp. fls2-241-R2A-40a TaxID=3040290 RepID=UPI00254B7F96|nr:hypothetical protein [Leifsonia sp. fls2-241-R2A-40a]